MLIKMKENPSPYLSSWPGPWISLLAYRTGNESPWITLATTRWFPPKSKELRLRSQLPCTVLSQNSLTSPTPFPSVAIRELLFEHRLCATTIVAECKNVRGGVLHHLCGTKDLYYWVQRIKPTNSDLMGAKKIAPWVTMLVAFED